MMHTLYLPYRHKPHSGEAEAPGPDVRAAAWSGGRRTAERGPRLVAPGAPFWSRAQV